MTSVTDQTVERISILIVDDEENVTRSLERNLRDHFIVYTANSGLQALDILSKHEIAVILADQRMPEMGGVEFLQAAQKIQPESLSMIISGYSDINALVTALNINSIRGFLSKPWDINHLKTQIHTAAVEYKAIFHDKRILRNSVETIVELQSLMANLKYLLDTIVFEESTDSLSDEENQQQKESQQAEATTMASFYQNKNTEISSNAFGVSYLKNSDSDSFNKLAQQYQEVLENAFEQRIYRIEYPISDKLKALAESLGFLRAGPRDVIEIHYHVLQSYSEIQNAAKRSIYNEEGRMLILELMGYMVQFYRRYYPQFM